MIATKNETQNQQKIHELRRENKTLPKAQTFSRFVEKRTELSQRERENEVSNSLALVQRETLLHMAF